MNSKRVKMLEKHTIEDPQDPFPKYALALEYLGDRDDLAYNLFTKLLKEHPDYIPTYYHAAHLFAEMEKRSLAERTFKKGIEVSATDPKANAELRNAYQNFLFEE